MKNYTKSRSRKRGFTLIELLVVIAIIAILASMGFGAGAMAINRAKKVHALSDCANLVQAVQAFYDDYNTLPDVPSADSSPGAKTESLLMNMLVGFDKDSNPKGVRYFQGKDAKGTTAARSYGGLFYEGKSVELLDPWRKVSGNATSNRHFFVMLDGDYDDEMNDPFNSGKPLYGRRAIAWCAGKDGEYTLGQQTNAKNRDNVYSWQ
ncbi:MAG: type II secretion system protein [Roseibacillus sp.]